MKTLNPNDLGKKYLVEECQKISINTFSRQANKKMKEAFMTSQIEIMDKSIKLATSNLHFGGVRYWFECPLCGKKVGTLFIHPLSQRVGCRCCLKLEYRKRRYKGMIEG
ncbi:MAG: hypothetical protein NTW46_03875 [Candidatus Nealsonbacteria bacterium]|nr:hypothetical protein [Candidatus Nealsonbacteria bacterium]